MIPGFGRTVRALPACVQKVKDRQHGVTPGAILVAVNICPMKPRENLRKTQGKPQLN
jgi:hypothetical protein